MSIFRRRIIGVLAMYALSLVWGYARLPWASIKHLRDFELVAHVPAVSFESKMNASSVQLWYLKRCVTESPVPTVPRLTIQVHWNVFVLAHVTSGHYVGPEGAEQTSDLYFCFFGAWIPLYNFVSKMA